MLAGYRKLGQPSCPANTGEAGANDHISYPGVDEAIKAAMPSGYRPYHGR